MAAPNEEKPMLPPTTTTTDPIEQTVQVAEVSVEHKDVATTSTTKDDGDKSKAKEGAKPTLNNYFVCLGRDYQDLPSH
jgi:hypothetical protein